MLMERKNNPLDIEILLTLEHFFNFKFPEQYRKFMLRYNGGEPVKKVFFYKGTSLDGSIIDYFFGFVPDKYENILLYWRDYRDRVPSNTFPIARDPGGNLILLTVKGPDRGKVYFWDHEQEADPDQGEVPSYDNLTLIADSFDEFINSLHEMEDIE